MTDLIRREDALRVTLAYSSSYSAEQAETAIRALPAAQPDAMSDEVEDLVGWLLDWPYQGETMAEAAAVLIKQLTAERDRLRDALSMIAVMGFSDDLGETAVIARMAVEQSRAILKRMKP